MARPQTARQNFLYVAPSVALIRQMDGNLRRALAESEGSEVRNVNLIHAENAEHSARADALLAINSTEADDGRVLLITTQTFLRIISAIDHPERWRVILDEAFAPVMFASFNLGDDARAGWDYFCELFDVEGTQAHRIVPREGQRLKVEDVAIGRLTRAGGKYEGLRRVAEVVSNPAMRCELIASPRVRALIDGTALPPAQAGDDADSLLQFASYVEPSFFGRFADVLFLSALFEQTLLYALWTRALGVTFEEHPEFPRELLRDTHAEQARFLAVGHLLHPDDIASKENLFRNVMTGERRERAEGQRVIDQVVRTAAVHFSGSRFLLQVNRRTSYQPGAPLVPTNATMIPAYAHGLNEFQEVHNVAALCVTNPTPQQRAWVRERTGMTAEEVGLSWRVHSVYQALGRCSIRNAALADHPKTVLTVGKADAEFIRDLFPGSRWLGQVGALPSLRSLAGRTSAVGKIEATAQLIRNHLEELDSDVTSVTSRSLKAAVAPDCPPRTWAKAVTEACDRGCGWIREKSSVRRLLASDYGLTATA